MRLLAQTRQPETDTKRPEVDTLTKKLEMLSWQLQKENKPEKLEALQGRECTIYAHDGERYVVQVAVNGALREMDVRSLEDRKYQTGDRTTIVKVESGIMYIQ